MYRNLKILNLYFLLISDVHHFEASLRHDIFGFHFKL